MVPSVATWHAHLFDDAPYTASHVGDFRDTTPCGASRIADFPHDARLAGPQGRVQFDYARAPRIFGGRQGHGPLLLAPDTTELIRLVDKFDDLEGSFGFDGRLLRGEWTDPTHALGDLFAIWFWRDVRFLIPDGYLTNSRSKPLSAERLKSRRRVLDALRADLFARGGVARKPNAGTSPRRRSPF